MRLRPMLVAMVAFLAACGSSSAHTSTATPAHPGAPTIACGPATAKTLAASARARVYQVGSEVYGCAASGRGSFRLGNATHTIRELRAGPVAVAGDLAAYGLTSFGIDTVRAQVVVRRLTDGARLQAFPATKAVGAESFESVGSVVVKPDGAVAWIAHESSIGARGQTTEVQSARAGGSNVVVASGSGIDPSSLRLRGSTLSWRDAGVTRRATLR
ncbi:MAG TPA: hypothetical protein VHZ27_21095 [Solirubrobacteraceae bacterium]|nr:hypothetical protein [Solirubrobacteraceae bacterium]